MEKELVKERVDNLLVIYNTINSNDIDENEKIWDENEKVLFEKYSKIIECICVKFNITYVADFNHYGSGYSSFIDCWFPKQSTIAKDGIPITGLIVLFHRVYDYYVIGEGGKSFTPTGSWSYFPKLELIDSFSSKEMKVFAKNIEKILTDNGLKRLKKKHLNHYLPVGYSVRTLMSESPYTYFDGLFHWTD